MDATNLWNIAREIPPEWYGHDADAISHLIEAIHKRRSFCPRSDHKLPNLVAPSVPELAFGMNEKV
jgi:hypothetical protein